MQFTQQQFIENYRNTYKRILAFSRDELNLAYITYGYILMGYELVGHDDNSNSVNLIKHNNIVSIPYSIDKTNTLKWVYGTFNKNVENFYNSVIERLSQENSTDDAMRANQVIRRYNQLTRIDMGKMFREKNPGKEEVANEVLQENIVRLYDFVYNPMNPFNSKEKEGALQALEKSLEYGEKLTTGGFDINIKDVMELIQDASAKNHGYLETLLNHDYKNRPHRDLLIYNDYSDWFLYNIDGVYYNFTGNKNYDFETRKDQALMKYLDDYIVFKAKNKWDMHNKVRNPQNQQVKNAGGTQVKNENANTINNTQVRVSQPSMSINNNNEMVFERK